MTQRFKLTLEYDGSNYCGYQKQSDIAEKTIEGELEKAIFQLTQENVKITVSGRTDAGVHALGQVVNFDLSKNFDPYKMLMGLNNYLRDEDISVLNCELVNENFSARFDSKMRHYRYKIINRRAPLALQKKRAHHFIPPLDISLMQKAANFLLGEHDFSSFRDAECQASSPIRTLEKITISRNGEEIFIDVSAKSFLHHMVRNIAGTLIWAGVGKISPEEVKKILEARDRTKSGPNAPACGLYFLGVDY